MLFKNLVLLSWST